MPTNDNDATFGMGQGEGSGGDRSWSAPVHAADSNGNPVAVSFGQGNQEGQTLIASGHNNFLDFYGDKNAGVQPNHDHYGKEAILAKTEIVDPGGSCRNDCSFLSSHIL